VECDADWGYFYFKTHDGDSVKKYENGIQSGSYVFNHSSSDCQVEGMNIPINWSLSHVEDHSLSISDMAKGIFTFHLLETALVALSKDRESALVLMNSEAIEMPLSAALEMIASLNLDSVPVSCSSVCCERFDVYCTLR